MSQEKVQNVVIVGGGTAGWITAAMLAKFLGLVVNIRLIESDHIGRVGVGEATIPPILRINRLLGMSEAEMMKACGATFKLGIQFQNWGHVGESYLHGFGHSGVHLNNLQFHHYWLKCQSEGLDSDFWDFSIHEQACRRNLFTHNAKGQNGMTDLIYAYHFDAHLYAAFLRKYAEKLGVVRTEGKVVDVNLDSDSGDIASVTMENGDAYEGDLFVDCSGFRSILMGEALGVKYQDWTKWLPCNRAVACSSERVGALPPYTRARAHSAGWQWRIPLQHRNGDGHVYCGEFMEAEEAEQILINDLDGEIIGTPNHIKFTTGRREQFWYKNCVSIGLSGGFLEPLESTSIHLIQTHAGKLVDLFPGKIVQPSLRDEYNRQTLMEFELIRDFLILHYHRTDREDSEFWKYCKNMVVPDTLRDKMELFRNSAKLRWDREDLFSDSSWVQVMLGQGLLPKQYHKRADALDSSRLPDFLHKMKSMIDMEIGKMPLQEDYIANYCRADIS